LIFVNGYQRGNKAKKTVSQACVLQCNKEVNEMNVILLETVGKLGNLGDQVVVKAGYGRNYLIPFGKAVPATKANVASLAVRREELEANAAKLLSEAENRAEAMRELTVTIMTKASDGGKLFGSVGTRDIAEAVTASGHRLDKSEVRLTEGYLRRTGSYAITVQFHTDVMVDINLVIASE
jgi:large subunit ribosomal protein L9